MSEAGYPSIASCRAVFRNASRLKNGRLLSIELVDLLTTANTTGNAAGSGFFAELAILCDLGSSAFTCRLKSFSMSQSCAALRPCEKRWLRGADEPPYRFT